MLQPSPQHALDRSGTLAVVLATIAQGVALFVAHAAVDGQTATLFGSRTLLFVWYTVALLAPLVVVLLMRSARDWFAWGCGLAAVVLDGLLALHTGNDCSGEGIFCGPVAGPYIVSMAIAHFILLPFVQVWREHGRALPYPALFHYAWDNALTLAATGFFIGVAWLILVLWAALFNMVGVAFFRELFVKPIFIYPVTGLFAGVGIVLARHQAGALQAVLRVCLALGRALLPLIAILALVFLPTLLVTGLQPLWNTGHATALLLALVFGTVTLVNSVLHDGTGIASYQPALRRLMGVALLTLPVYAVLAMVALGLRVSQYAWSVERLWAALAVLVATAYAFAYALSFVLPRRGERFGWLAPANTAVALLVAALLLATQSPLLDLRSITVASQLARHGDDLDALDLAYFRFSLARPGNEALAALAEDPRVKASPELAEKVAVVREATNRWQAAHPPPRLPSDVAVIPAGTVLPEGLLEFANGRPGTRRAFANLGCEKDCIFVAVDLSGGPEPEWVLMAAETTNWAHRPILGRRDGEWAVVGHLQGALDKEAVAALQDGNVRVAAPEWRDVVIGGKRLRVQPE